MTLCCTWMIAVVGNGALYAFFTKFKPILLIILVLCVLRVLIGILRSTRRARRRRKCEKSLGHVRTQFWGSLVFAALEFWLWNYKGLFGRFLAIAIPMVLVALMIVVVQWRRRRSSSIVVDAGTQDDRVAAQAGEVGERMVRETLKGLPSDRYLVLHDVWLPMEDGGVTQIDHVIVSPFGIFIIETKNWKGVIYGNGESAVWTKFNCGHKAVYKNPIRQNYKHLVSVREKFFRPEVEFAFGVVAMSPAAKFKDRVPDGIVFYNELKGWILGHVTPCIKPDQIEDIVTAIHEWSVTVSEDARRRHCGGAAEELKL